MRFLLIIFILLTTFSNLLANDTIKARIPLSRQLFHDRIDDEQRQIDKLDGNADGIIRLSGEEEVVLQASDALFRQVDLIQLAIEKEEALPSSNEKIRYLRYVEEMLQRFRILCRSREIPVSRLPAIISDLEGMIRANIRQENLSHFVYAVPYQVASMYCDVFSDYNDIQSLLNITYIKYCGLFPDKIISTIEPFAEYPFADSLIVVYGTRNPVLLYSYAQSRNSVIGRLIHRNRDPLISRIADISQMPNGLFYYPFMDDLITGRKEIEQLHKLVGDGEADHDTIGYFKLLVQTNIDYYRRMAPPLLDTPVAMLGPNGIREMLRSKSIQHFISPINELHNEPDLDIRLASIEKLSATEIYYLIVMGENDIYTSSFKHSFNRMLQKMGANPRGDSLLQQVHFDYFRKFLKMAAGYNRLDTFLKTMPKEKSEVLMKAFVANLDKGGNLEDAVDVADAFGSITDLKLQQNILRQVQQFRDKSISESNKRGEVIYDLLNTIFHSLDSTSGIDLNEKLGIPSVTTVNAKELQDDSGRIVQQVFFYGDEDGNKIFPVFLNSFSSKEWSILHKPEWVEIKSLKGKVWIFANKPLDYDANMDDSAQIHLGEYLEENELHPSVVVHRGHSYWLPGTISRMPVNAVIVVIGSCGGYKNLHEILDVSPDAHIISTKEIGTGEINRPIINYLNQSFLSGKPIDWRVMWLSLHQTFSKESSKELKESWQHYVPPYKNLGAIFIKSYNKLMESIP